MQIAIEVCCILHLTTWKPQNGLSLTFIFSSSIKFCWHVSSLVKIRQEERKYFLDNRADFWAHLERKSPKIPQREI